MELLYNPDQMPESEIKATFVAREKLVDDLRALVSSQPDGAGTQHVVIIAPRGMGNCPLSGSCNSVGLSHALRCLCDKRLSREYQVTGTQFRC